VGTKRCLGDSITTASKLADLPFCWLTMHAGDQDAHFAVAHRRAWK
jgi:hypothetical protein